MNVLGLGGIVLVTDDLPGDWRNVYLLQVATFLFRLNFDEFIAQCHNFADGAIDIPAIRVIFEQHYLRIDFQAQGCLRRILGRVEVSSYGGQVLAFGQVNFAQFPLIDAVGGRIAGAERDVKIFGFKIRLKTFVQFIQIVLISVIEANAVQEAQKMPIVLAVHFPQFQHFDFKSPLENLCRKEKSRIVGGTKNLLLKITGYYGGKLKQVPKKHHLYPTKGQRTVAIEAQEVIDVVQHVGTHHGYFVDDQHFHVAVEPTVFAFADLTG